MQFSIWFIYHMLHSWILCRYTFLCITTRFIGTLVSKAIISITVWFVSILVPKWFTALGITGGHVDYWYWTIDEEWVVVVNVRYVWLLDYWCIVSVDDLLDATGVYVVVTCVENSGRSILIISTITIKGPMHNIILLRYLLLLILMIRNIATRTAIRWNNLYRLLIELTRTSICSVWITFCVFVLCCFFEIWVVVCKEIVFAHFV